MKLPLYRQSHDFTCGVACVASVLRYAGYEFDTREDKLLWELAASPENGTNCTTIVQYLRSIVHSGETKKVLSIVTGSCNYMVEKDDTPVLYTLTQFRSYLDEGKPIICVIQAWKEDGDYTTKTENDGHYVILVGYKEDSEDKYIYYFMDPSTAGSYTYLTQEEFILRWHDEENGKSYRIYVVIDYLDRKDELLDKAFHLG